MKKRILGLDLGTTSIGWAYVIEGETAKDSSIEQIGVRITQLDNFVSTETGKESKDPINDFNSGKGISPNAGRTLKRGARRNLDRYQDRRKNLIEILLSTGILHKDANLNEAGKGTTYQTWEVRAKAAKEKIELDEFARVLLAINKKRGYKSSRKAKNEEEGEAIDGMAIAKRLYEENLTPGQFVFNRLNQGKKSIPDFYRSDLQEEFDKIWNFQKQFHSGVLTDEFYESIKGKGQRATSALFWTTYQFNTADIKDLEDGLKDERTIKLNLRDKKKLQAYKWRSEATSVELGREELAFVLTEINNNLNQSSGYLGAISDRSKELYFNKETVGEYLYKRLQDNRHTSLKNLVFYRQDYLDEFETIWEKQANYHPQLTKEVKAEIRDVIIFYQRKLKSQKGLISFCEFENRKKMIDGKEKTVGLRVIPKSSPLFQEFKIWQRLHDVKIKKKGSRKRKVSKDIQGSLFTEEKEIFSLTQEEKELLFEELNFKGDLTANEVLSLLGYKSSEYEINYPSLDGNRTNKELNNAFLKIVDLAGYDVRDLLRVKSNKDEVELADIKVQAKKIKELIQKVFETLNIDPSILEFNAELDGKAYEKQASYRLWHLLYSYEGDDSLSGNETLYRLLKEKFNFDEDYAKILSNVPLQDDYGNLSSKAIRKIYPFIKESQYSDACEFAGYRHSKHSLTKEELDARVLKKKLDPLAKNSLRNPVVEKILNQMVNVINTLIDKENDKLEKQGKKRDFQFDEIRIELARELKKSASERNDLEKAVRNGKSRNDKIRDTLQNEFGIKNPTRNDVIRYRLYQELKENGYKDLYTDKYISLSDLFSKNIDIEHIIPQSRMFDDSFSNKTLAFRNDNLKKGSQTALDYIRSEYGEEGVETYMSRVRKLFELNQKNVDNGISKAKYRKLLMTASEIKDGFIERDLRETQYIAKKAKEMLFEITKSVVSTSGAVTDRLREEWGLINIMKELNLPKYRALGLTELQERRSGQQIEVIKDWTKRNDHRHHAMDALAVAFTKHSHIQYLNYLNARKDVNHKLHNSIKGIEDKELELVEDKNGNRRRRFREPILNFRQEAKKHLESIIISHKAKNKVVTINKNKIRGQAKPQITLTPRGQLHKETVYGKYHYYVNKEEKVGPKFNQETIDKVSNPLYKSLLELRLKENDNDPKKAFGGKNALSKNPIYLNDDKTEVMPEKVNLMWLEEDYSIRKEINPENFKTEKLIDKVLDEGIKRILKTRLNDFGGDAKKAFSDLEINPIWLNKEKGIAIKRVTISGVKNAEPLNYKKDHFGEFIIDEKGKKIPVDFVSTGNNHHVAIYRDEKGNLQERVVSFFETVKRVNLGLPIIFNKPIENIDLVLQKGIKDPAILTSLPEKDWEFLFTMKQNELFVFPNEKTGFDPNKIDLMDEVNKKEISENLFRVQKFTIKDYFFRHHLETNVETLNDLKGTTWLRIGLASIEGIVKVRTNHLGDIVQVGEY